MKKILLFISIAAGIMSANAQTPFFKYTTYRGAFEPAPATPWTAGWVNWNPQVTAYPATTVNVPAGDITTNTTWTANNVYKISDFIYVTNNATLTIEPGTIIRGEGNGTIIICRGAKIMAEGTATQPIVFTSNQPSGDRDYGDWGGIVLTGKAYNNIPTSPMAPCEGGIAKPTGTDGYHGGTDDNDNSGSLKYVRIEYSGQALTTASNSEINGLTFYSVGNGTTIDYIQVSYCGDDSYEWFGGTVDCKHLIAYKGFDDDFDTDNGYRGRVQFGLSIRDSRFADQSSSNSFESDNDAQGSNNTPKTEAVFSNMTSIGPNWAGNPDSTNILYRRGLHIRRNSGISVYNSIFTGWPSSGLYLDSRKTCANYQTGVGFFAENIFAGCTNNINWANGSDTLGWTSRADVIAWAMAAPQGTDTLVTSQQAELMDPFGNSNWNPDARPKATSVAATGAVFTNPELLPINTVGVENSEIVENSFIIYPNPASNDVNISFAISQNGKYSISLLDLTGKTILNIPTTNYSEGTNFAQINVTSLSKGIYFVRLDGANSSKVTKLMVK